MEHRVSRSPDAETALLLSSVLKHPGAMRDLASALRQLANSLEAVADVQLATLPHRRPGWQTP